MVPADRGWFDTMVGVAGALNAVLLLVLLAILAPGMWSFLRSLRELRAILDRVYDDLKPFTGHANRIAANIDDITETVRAEVKAMTATIAQANQGLNRAVESTEKRIREVGALLDVAQKEAERAFVSTAAAVHGVRAGAAAAVRRDKKAPEAGEPDASPATPARPRVRARRKRPE